MPQMTTIDWIIVAFTLVLAFYGYAQGFIVGVLSLAGFALGAFLGTRFGPLLLPAGAHSRYAPMFGLLGALLAGGVLASGFEGIGMRFRSALRIPGFHMLDGLLGAALTACVALGIAWIVGAVALQSANSRPLRVDIQRSVILRALNRALPPSGPILHALARFDPLPSIRGPAVTVAPPGRGILGAAAVRAARPAVVRILGTACGLGVEGSGWLARPGIVVTNAHVVAGETDTVVQAFGRAPGDAARALAFDPHDDVAILSVAGLPVDRALPLAADPPAGTEAAILGYPLDGPYDEEPGRIGVTQDVTTEDAYGNGPVTRSVTPLRGRVRPGNSGGPMVDAAGAVVGTVFAATTTATGAPSHAGYAVPDAIVRRVLARAVARRAVVSTGPCAG
jgi:S1-C subfamily serine protease